MRYYLIGFLIIILAGLQTKLSFKNLANLNSKQLSELEETPIYLPKKSALKAISFGYHNTTSHILWFQTVNYFGKHYRGDKVYSWLEHMCELSTELNQNAKHIYEFCGLMLAWEAGRPDLAEKILAKFIKSAPETWRPYYLQGMNSAIFAKDGEAAKKYFIQASKTPKAPAFLAGLASKKIAELENKDLAIAFLKAMIQQTKDESQRESLKKKLVELEQKDL